MTTDSDKPVIGLRYAATAEDCCVSFQFVATLIEIAYAEWDDEHEYPTLVFDNTVVITNSSIVKLIQIASLA